MVNSKCKILLVDDEEDVIEFLSYNLRKEGYQVSSANNGREAIEKATAIRPHLIILDVMMPQMDGIEACQRIKKIESLKNTLVIFLTARSEDYSQIAGFEAGADDYVAKPIKPQLLISRIKALLRRYQSDEGHFAEPFVSGGLTIDQERFMVILEGHEIAMPKKEFELLQLLTSRPDKVFSREEIFSKVWGNHVVVGDRTIDVHVRKIREKIGIGFIKTIKGVGYKFDPI